MEQKSNLLSSHLHRCLRPAVRAPLRSLAFSVLETRVSFSESSFAVYAMNAPDDVKCALMDVVKGVWDEVDSRSGCESRCLRSRCVVKRC